jgi:hypothetical protein
MALKLTNLDNTNEKAWDDLVLSSLHSTIFHTLDWLRLAEKQSQAEFLPCMFFKGTQLIAIYPVFIQKPAGIISSVPCLYALSWAGNFRI